MDKTNFIEAGTYCEKEYGTTQDTKEDYFICPECGEPLLLKDWKHNWDFCPICGFEFMED